MGFHDYICYITQNGQSIEHFDIPDDEFIKDLKLNSDTGGSNCAYFVDVSDEIDKNIVECNLIELNKFPKKSIVYSWDNWEFKKYKGYYDFICYDRLIFKHAGKKYLTIDPIIYEKFISNQNPKNILYCDFYNIINKICSHKRHEKNGSNKYKDLDIIFKKINWKEKPSKSYLYNLITCGTHKKEWKYDMYNDLLKYKRTEIYNFVMVCKVYEKRHDIKIVRNMMNYIINIIIC